MRNAAVVAIAGVAFAVILVFMNLGFGIAGKISQLDYNQIDADIYLMSPQTLKSAAASFSIERIYQAEGIDGVQRTMPLYVGISSGATPNSKSAMFVFGINPVRRFFLLPEFSCCRKSSCPAASRYSPD